jgi:hypothetical protein
MPATDSIESLERVEESSLFGEAKPEGQASHPRGILEEEKRGQAEQETQAEVRASVEPSQPTVERKNNQQGDARLGEDMVALNLEKPVGQAAGADTVGQAISSENQPHPDEYQGSGGTVPCPPEDSQKPEDEEQQD